MPAPTCGPNVIALNAPSSTPTTSPPMADGPIGALARQAPTSPRMRPSTAPAISPTTSGRTPGSTPTRVDVPDGRIGAVGQVESESDAHDDGDHHGDRERPGDALGADAHRAEDAAQGDRREREDAVEDAPADRAQDPLPEEERGPDDQEERRR